MRAVQQKKRFDAENFHPAFPARFSQPGADGRVINLHAAFFSNFQRRQSQRRIGQLVASRKRNAKPADFPVDPEIVDRLVVSPDDFKVLSQTVQLGFFPAADGGQMIRHPLLRDAGNADSSLFDDSGLFFGHRRQRAAQISRVLKSDIGDDGNQRTADVGRVEPAAKPDFRHRNVRLRPLKINKRRRGQRFKVGYGLAGFGLNFRQNAAQIASGNLFSVQHNPLPNIHQMRRRVQSGPEARLLENGSGHRGR